MKKMSAVWQEGLGSLSPLRWFLWCKGPCSLDSQVKAGIIKRGVWSRDLFKNLTMWGEKPQTTNDRFNLTHLTLVDLGRCKVHHIPGKSSFSCIFLVVTSYQYFLQEFFGSNNTLAHLNFGVNFNIVVIFIPCMPLHPSTKKSLAALFCLNNQV